MKLAHLRLDIYHILERSNQMHRFGRVIEICLITLIAINILAVTLETVDSIQQKYTAFFAILEQFSILVFSIEYLLRVWVNVEDPRYKNRKYPRLAYIFSPMALIDLLAVLPFYLTLFFALDLRVLRVLRLLRVFKLTRYSSAMAMILGVFREEASTFFAAFFILLVLLILAASGAYMVEHSAQPDEFGSIPQAMWWAIVTLTTVGYGDVIPITAAGKVFGAFVTVIGVGIAALPAGILASGLAEQLRERRNSLRNEFRRALDDGVIDATEEEELENMRKQLGLSKRMLGIIKEEIKTEAKQRVTIECPKCGHSHNINKNSNK
ncbi:MAG TPA: Ion transport protein [Rhodobacteraceae bacterium]|jgi:voltage-gated potassium channel|nr:Ion transport protein [Paracoccaceae bacterium]